MRRTVLFLALAGSYGLFLQRGSASDAVARLDVVGPPAREIEAAIAETRFADALPLVLELRVRHPHEPVIALWLAAVYKGLGRPAEEAEAWERFIASGLQGAEGCPELAEAYARVGAEPGLRAYQRCVQLDPEDAERQVDLGRALERAGRTAEAQAAYRRAAALDPHHPLAVDRLERVHGRMEHQ
jgi:Flp pilus assembly protein TadD